LVGLRAFWKAIANGTENNRVGTPVCPREFAR